MRIKRGLLKPILALLLSVLLQTAFGIRAQAETERSRIAAMPGGKDLTVMFTFDRENTDITFISPSGSSISKGDERLEFAEGELWSTYRVSEAEAGDWWVEYDRGANDQIEYSVLEESYGLWIQYLRLEEVAEGKLTASFLADWEDEYIRYNYELWAVCEQDGSMSRMLTSGSAPANQENTVTASLNSLNSGHYTLRLEVSCRDGDAEIFDSVTGEEFDFTNTGLPEAMQGARVYLNMSDHTCGLDWSDARSYSDRGYKVIVSCDSQEIYHGELDSSVGFTTAVYPVNGTALQISLSCKRGDLWSVPLEWNLDLQTGEALRTRALEVTGEGQMVLEYAVTEERMLTLTVNGEEGQFLLEGSGQFSVSLQQGQNQVRGEFEGEEGVCYVLDRLIYYDAIPPEILLYDDLDGKTFYEDYVDIIGAIEGGGSLTVNGEAFSLGDQGEFCCRVALSPGENVAELRAVDGNGNASVQALTLYRGNRLAAVAGNRGLLGLLPLFTALLGSLLVILLAFLYMRKKEKKTVRKRTLTKWVPAVVALGILEAGCVLEYIRYCLFVRSVKYLEAAEGSIAKAAEYLRIKRVFGVGAIVGLGLFLASLTALLLLSKRKRRQEEQ